MSHAWVIPDKTIYLMFCCVTLFFIFFHLFLCVLLGGRSEGSSLHQLLVYNHGLTFSVFLTNKSSNEVYIYSQPVFVVVGCFLLLLFWTFLGGGGAEGGGWFEPNKVEKTGSPESCGCN